MTADTREELVFAALGGLGEIGMNAALYGYGPPAQRKWLLVDLGVAFAGDELPGIDLLMPNIEFIERVKQNLVGIIVTHAHEDHIGAIADLWPRLGGPVYATRFSAGLLETKRLSEPGAPRIPIHVVELGSTVELGPFRVEFIAVAHSIPEGAALAITTPVGTVVHTGDWKIDATPLVGRRTDEARLRAIGEAGTLALVCDSTNIMRTGVSPSEADVAEVLTRLIVEAPRRVVVTTFASNVARIRAVAQAAMASERQVVVVGRAMERVIAVARECGYLDGLPAFLPANSFDRLPSERIVALATGSQGEPRAALARIAQDDHPEVTLTPGDRVIFSSRTIPGNEKPVGRIINGLIEQGIEVITDRTDLVHVSGHPRRDEVAQMYAWLRPGIAIPAHGEALHLAEHAKFAKEQGVPTVLKAANGDLVRIAPGEPAIIDEVAHGRWLKDGLIIASPRDDAVNQRVRLGFAGVVSIAVALTGKGDVAGDPDVLYSGLPERGITGKPMDEIVDDAIFGTLDSLPRARRRDTDLTATAVERAVRSAVNNAWGKRPLVHVLVVEI